MEEYKDEMDYEEIKYIRDEENEEENKENGRENMKIIERGGYKK